MDRSLHISVIVDGSCEKAAITDATWRTATGAGRHTSGDADNIFKKLTVVAGELASSPTRQTYTGVRVRFGWLWIYRNVTS
jgi:hypothetical protein